MKAWRDSGKLKGYIQEQHLKQYVPKNTFD